MNSIKGYITIPFHGEKGESAYDIAVKHGYEGTEEEWVDHLGFIPDKSIDVKKFNEELSEFIETTEKVKNLVSCYTGEYKAEEFNIYTQQREEYAVPYILKGTSGFAVKVPKLSPGVTVFDENDASLYSDALERYSMAKMDVEVLVGKKIRIKGKTQTMPFYPLGFCVDENGNIIERYGEEAYCVYGYVLPENYATYTTEKDALEVVVPQGAKYIYIQGGTFSSAGQVVLDVIPAVEVYGESKLGVNKLYKNMQSPLWGKKLYVDGDSICYGNGYAGGFGRIIADTYNMELVNNAVGGATIAQDTTNDASFGSLDWENNDYYLRLQSFNVEKNVSGEGFSMPITKEVYENGFGVYPTVYRLVSGELVEQEYSETMPSYTFFVKFDVPTYGENTVEKYYRMWSLNNWLWEAYRSGFAAAHEAGTAKFGTARHWLCKSVDEITPDADYVIFEGGLNDYLMDRPVGTITEGMSEVVDTTTTVGAMEYLCRGLLEKCVGKKIVFVLTPKAKNYAYILNPAYSTSKATFTDYHDAILSVLRKYSIPCVDLFNTSMLNTEIPSHLIYTMKNDGVHPTKEGYELFFVPQIVSMAERI